MGAAFAYVVVQLVYGVTPDGADQGIGGGEVGCVRHEWLPKSVVMRALKTAARERGFGTCSSGFVKRSAALFDDGLLRFEGGEK